MRIHSLSSLIDYDYLKYLISINKLGPESLSKSAQNINKDTFVSSVKKQALKSFNNENRKSYLRSITSRR